MKISAASTARILSDPTSVVGPDRMRVDQSEVLPTSGACGKQKMACWSFGASLLRMIWATFFEYGALRWSDWSLPQTFCSVMLSTEAPGPAVMNDWVNGVTTSSFWVPMFV